MSKTSSKFENVGPKEMDWMEHNEETLEVMESTVEGVNGWLREFFIYQFLTMTMHCVFIDKANGRKRSKMNNTLCFSFEPMLPTQVGKRKKNLLSTIYALDWLHIDRGTACVWHALIGASSYGNDQWKMFGSNYEKSFEGCRDIQRVCAHEGSRNKEKQ